MGAIFVLGRSHPMARRQIHSTCGFMQALCRTLVCIVIWNLCIILHSNRFRCIIFFFIVHVFLLHSIGYPVVTLGFGVKSYVGYRIRHRKQREVAKENEFYMQLLQLALPNDELLHAQMKQAPEILHSDKLGDIDLPVSSAIIAQRIQQQQLLMMSSSHAPSPSNNCKYLIFLI